MEPKETTPADAGQSQPEPAPDTNGGESSDAIFLPKAAFNDRLARAKQSAVNELLQTLGVESVDDLKRWQQTAQTEAEKRQELESGQQSLTQKFETQFAEMKKQIDSLTQANAEAIKAKEQAEAKRLTEARNNAIRQAVKNAHDADDVIRWAETAGMLDGILTEDGNVDDKAVSALADKARQEKPHLFKTGPGIPSNNDGRVASKDDIKKRLGDKPLVRF